MRERFKIVFRKPFSRLKEGHIVDSIVAYNSSNYSYGDDYDQVRKRLIIDFWLFVIKIEWLRKKPPTMTEKIYGQIGNKRKK